jgi:hypothetical protein
MLKKLLTVAMLAAFSVANAQVLWEEDFENGTTLPAGWSQTTLADDGGWKIGTGPELASQYFPVPDFQGNMIGTNDDGCNCDKSADFLVLPDFNLSAVTSAWLTFDVFFIAGVYQGAAESLTIRVSTDNGANWTNLPALAGVGDWKLRGVNLSAYAGQASVKVGFLYNDGGDWLYGAMIDNLKLQVPDNTVKAGLNGVGFGRFVDAIPAVLPGYDKFWAGEGMAVAGTVNNNGFATISSFDATWSRGPQSVTQSFTGLNVGFAESYDFSMPVPTALGANVGDITVTISNINGGADNDASDNSAATDATVEGVQPVSGRKVLVEEATGTWCQWCPRGTVMMDFLAEHYPTTAALVAVHNNDPMKVTVYDSGMGALIGGYPSGVVDRAYAADIDPTQFEIAMINRLTEPPVVLVSQNVAYDAATRKVTVDSHLKFLEDVSGAHRIAVIYTQDGVTGTAANYGQANAYSGGGNGPMGGYEDLPGTVPAAQMVYDHVGRAIVGGFTGAANSVPATNLAGSEVVYTSTYTVPASYNVNNMRCITALLNTTTGEAVNAESTPIPYELVGANEAISKIVSFSMFPNPVQDVTTVSLKLEETSDVQIRVVDVNGKIVLESNYSNMSGEQQLQLQLGQFPVGAYTLSVQAKNHVASELFVIQR